MIPYDLTKIKAAVFDVDGVLSPSTVPMNEAGVPVRMVNIKDGYAMQLAAKKGLKMAIITGADTPSIAVRYHALGINDVYLKASDKLPLLESWMEANRLSREEVAYVGDDIPDIPAMTCAGLRVCPADAADDVKEASNYISRVPGGHGVARDLLEQILSAQDKWITEHNDYLW